LPVGNLNIRDLLKGVNFRLSFMPKRGQF